MSVNLCFPGTMAISSIPDRAVLAEGVRGKDGTLLLSRGQQLSRTLRLRLSAFAARDEIAATVKIAAS